MRARICSAFVARGCRPATCVPVMAPKANIADVRHGHRAGTKAWLDAMIDQALSLDWELRHDFLSRIYRRYPKQYFKICGCLSPDQALNGKLTGIKPPKVITMKNGTSFDPPQQMQSDIREHFR